MPSADGQKEGQDDKHNRDGTERQSPGRVRTLDLALPDTYSVSLYIPSLAESSSSGVSATRNWRRWMGLMPGGGTLGFLRMLSGAPASSQKPRSLQGDFFQL